MSRHICTRKSHVAVADGSFGIPGTYCITTAYAPSLHTHCHIAMSMILREIDVDIVRINPRGMSYASGSPQYVFAVHPLDTRVVRPRLHNGTAITSTFVGSALRPIRESELPVAHEVARSYSQCRKLFKELTKLTDGTQETACRCCCFLDDARCEPCPFRTLCSLLDAFMFPRRRLFHRRTPGVFQERRFALNLFIKSVLQKLQSFHDIDFLQQQERDFFRSLQGAASSFAGCKVMAALLRFLALDEGVVVKLRETSQRLFGKLNLEGWHSDRKNLYFINEDNDQGDDNNGKRDTSSNSSMSNCSSSNSRCINKDTRNTSSSAEEETDQVLLLAASSRDLDEKENLRNGLG